MDAPERLRRLPSWLLSEAARRGHVLVTDGFAEEGLRKPHYTVLVALSELGPSSQAELGRRLWIDRKNMVGVINVLEALGMVERTPDEQDRRRNAIRLTPAGVDALARLNARADAAQDELLVPLSETERRELERLLTKLL
jgi:MarR family transcriptional regulator, lower aerobic nicotinate degradation pathway regulator